MERAIENLDVSLKDIQAKSSTEQQTDTVGIETKTFTRDVDTW